MPDYSSPEEIREIAIQVIKQAILDNNEKMLLLFDDSYPCYRRFEVAPCSDLKDYHKDFGSCHECRDIFSKQKNKIKEDMINAYKQTLLEDIIVDKPTRVVKIRKK